MYHLAKIALFQQKIHRCFPIIIVALLLQATLTLSVQAEEKHITDRDISLAVTTKLLNDEGVSSHLIDVEAKDGIVTLSGSVDNLRAKDRAVAIAETIKGVRSVVNRIAVKPKPRSDEEIHKDVMNALRGDAATETYEIDVTVKDSIVTLTGAVDSWAEKQLCIEVVKGVKGVIGIKDKIDNLHKTQRGDSEIKTEIKRRVASDVWVDANLIDVKVENGHVTLTGIVGSAAEKSRATSDAHVASVKSVDNTGLKVQWWTHDEMERTRRPSLRSDEEIKKAVTDAFRHDPRVSDFNPTVEVHAGAVTLTGTVDNLKAKKSAEQDAKNTVGVWRVKNFLKVRPEDVPTDEEITEKVREAFRLDADLDRHQLDVYTRNGKVYLYGNVDTNYERLLAEDITTRIKGVIDVENQLRIGASWQPKPDREIKQDIKDGLSWSPLIHSNTISVSVEDGVATLTGTVDTQHEWRVAGDKAREGGAKAVHNHLRIKNNPSDTQP